ncbi:MAG: SDR family NAD(P)-dependent oxidoreductase [Pseudomonadota bacterium]
MSERVALVTGASRGLGAALAQALASTHHIIAVAKTAGGLEDLDDRIQSAGGQATLAPMDITNAQAMAHLAGSIAQRWGGLDVWLHTAVHAAPLSPVDHVSHKDWGKSFDVNVHAPAQMISVLAPVLKKDGAAVFFDDPNATGKFFASYAASKAAHRATVAAWQSETKNNGPQVHLLVPAPMPTATRARFFPGEDTAPLRPCTQVAQDVLQFLAAKGAVGSQ